MRRLCQVLIHLVIAAAVFGAVLPRARPLWTVPCAEGEVAYPIGYHPERGTLLSIEGAVHLAQNNTWRVVERDRETGRELHHCTVQAPPGRVLFERPVLVDGKRLFFMHGFYSNPMERTGVNTGIFLGPYHYGLQGEFADLGTGQCLGGSFECERVRDVYAADHIYGSFGRRWMQVCGDVFRVVSLADGKEVFRRPHPKHTPSAAFAPDDSHVALIELDDQGRRAIVVYALPSGEKHQTYDLPAGHRWNDIQAWRDGELILRESLPAGATRQECYSVPILGDQLGTPRLEPELYYVWGQARSMHRELAGDHVVRVIHEDPHQGTGWVHSVVQWINSRLGMDGAQRNTTTTAVQLVKRKTGNILGEVSWPDERYTIKVSSDLRRVACFSSLEGMQMWDLQPSPRWPVPLLLALLPTALWLLFRRWTSRRRARLAAANLRGNG